MKRGIIVSICMLAVALITMGANNSCRAPMDATGSYSGTWKGNAEGAEECELSMTLDQDITAEPLDNFKVTGSVLVDYSCIEFPDWFPAPDPSEVQVTGVMTKNGKITLASGGCGTGACIIFALDGEGESDEEASEEETPSMAACSGNWTVAIGVAFLRPFGAKGTFEVTRE